jgi:hypothetical protein
MLSAFVSAGEPSGLIALVNTLPELSHFLERDNELLKFE